MSRARLTRAVEFRARHRYWRPEWTESENRERLGAAADPAGHAHDFRCEVTVEGEVDPGTGMVVDLARLDRALRDEVVRPMDGATLNEMPDFHGPLAVPTTENIARVIWARLAGALPRGCRLARVRVAEDSALWSEYRGD